MNDTPPELKDFAQRLLAYESSANSQGETRRQTVFRVCEKLREPLSKLAGVAGFQALMAHALALAKAEEPSLAAVRVLADGSLEGLDDSNLNEEDAEKGGVVLIACLIGLLVTFIGSALTLGVLKSQWPEATFDTNDDSKGNEKP